MEAVKIRLAAPSRPCQNISWSPRGPPQLVGEMAVATIVNLVITPMTNLGIVQQSTADPWDDPVLAPYAAREASLEDSSCDDDEVERVLVGLWAEAVSEHPSSAGAYLRLASALRDANRFLEAAQVLRQGRAHGHTALLYDLIRDYPELVNHEEFESAMAEPTLVQPALLAVLAQAQNDDTLDTVSRLIKAQSEDAVPKPFPFHEVTRLVATLINADRLFEANQICSLVTNSHSEGRKLPDAYERVAEIAHAEAWLSPSVRSALVALTLHRDGQALQRALTDMSAHERSRVLLGLQQHCSRLFAAHSQLFYELSKSSRPGTRYSWPLFLGLGVLSVWAWWFFR